MPVLRACLLKQVDHGPGGSTPLVSSALRWTERIGGGLQNRLHAGSSPARSSKRPRCSRLHAGLPVRRSGFDPRWALTTHAWPIGMRHRPSKPARRVRFPPRAQSGSFAGRVLAPKPAS